MRYLISVFLIFFGFNAGAQTINSEIKSAPLVFPKIKSSVMIPVQIPLAEISNIINSSTPNLLFEDNSFTDNDNDQFKVKVWKTRPIRLVGGTKQNSLIEVPLKIWAEKGIG